MVVTRKLPPKLHWPTLQNCLVGTVLSDETFSEVMKNLSGLIENKVSSLLLNNENVFCIQK